MQYLKSDYKEYPKTLPVDDLWGQVRRTVNGKPISPEQIQMIVDAIKSGLELNSEDIILDLACGNGALSSYLFDDCSGLFGVDSSPYLIQVALSRFANLPSYDFKLLDAAGYVLNEPDPDRFTKVLCYGSFSFFPEKDAQAVLNVIHSRFKRVDRIFIGNLPDKDRAHFFYPKDKDYVTELDDPTAQIGIWRSENELRTLAENNGWKLRVVNMPEAFYAAHYRFDAILERV